MTAIGIDLGGTKIEAQVFDGAWNAVSKRRIETPNNYDVLVTEMGELMRWAEEQAGGKVPIGIGAAGLINPDSGLALTANLAASGQPFPSDLKKALGRPLTYINDCRALALSEAVFGQGQDHQLVMALVLGTGVGGGIAINKTILQGPTQTGGEFGHTSAPAHLVTQHKLPVIMCGCGRMGCIETYIAGPGLVRLAKHLTGQDVTPPEIAARRSADMKEVWMLWCDLTADLFHSLTLTVDPGIIILGGGLSRIEGVIADLEQATKRAQINGFQTPPLALAHGGDSSGARGAAYAAWQAESV